jgi:hypothetical protein
VVVEVGSLDEHFENMESHLLHIQYRPQPVMFAISSQLYLFVDVVIPISVCPFSRLYVLLMLYSILLADRVAGVASP